MGVNRKAEKKQRSECWNCALRDKFVINDEIGFTKRVLEVRTVHAPTVENARMIDAQHNARLRFLSNEHSSFDIAQARSHDARSRIEHRRSESVATSTARMFALSATEFRSEHRFDTQFP